MHVNTRYINSTRGTSSDYNNYKTALLVTGTIPSKAIYKTIGVNLYNNYKTVLLVRGTIHSKAVYKTIGVNFYNNYDSALSKKYDSLKGYLQNNRGELSLSARVLIAARLVSYNLLIQLRVYSTRYSLFFFLFLFSFFLQETGTTVKSVRQKYYTTVH